MAGGDCPTGSGIPTSPVENMLAATAAAGARLVMVNNLPDYGCPEAVITARSPEVATTRKGMVRCAVTRHLLKAHRRGDCPETIGRVSDYYGPGGTYTPVYVLGIKPALGGTAQSVPHVVTTSTSAVALASARQCVENVATAC